MPVHFLSLPRELRDIIYGLAISTNTTLPVPVNFINNPTKPSFFPPICHVNKQVRHESTLAFLKCSELKFFSGQYALAFTTWLQTLPGSDGFKAVRCLSLPCFDILDNGYEDEVQQYVSLILSCPALKEVSLGFHLRNIVRAVADFNWQTEQPIPLDDLERRLYLGNLLDVNGLGTLHLKCVDHMRTDQRVADWDSFRTFWHMEKYLQEGFKARGKSTTVRTTPKR